MYKDGGIKFVDNETVKELLLDAGWKLEELEAEIDDGSLSALKAEATELGIKFHPNIGEEKLQAKVDEAK